MARSRGQNRITDDFPNRAGDLRKMLPIDFLDASLMASVKAVLVVAKHVKAEQKSSVAERSNAGK